MGFCCLVLVAFFTLIFSFDYSGHERLVPSFQSLVINPQCNKSAPLSTALHHSIVYFNVAALENSQLRAAKTKRPAASEAASAHTEAKKHAK